MSGSSICLKLEPRESTDQKSISCLWCVAQCYTSRIPDTDANPKIRFTQRGGVSEEFVPGSTILRVVNSASFRLTGLQPEPTPLHPKPSPCLLPRRGNPGCLPREADSQLGPRTSWDGRVDIGGDGEMKDRDEEDEDKDAEDAGEDAECGGDKEHRADVVLGWRQKKPPREHSWDPTDQGRC